jgi:hypothetical protein
VAALAILAAPHQPDDEIADTLAAGQAVLDQAAAGQGALDPSSFVGSAAPTPTSPVEDLATATSTRSEPSSAEEPEERSAEAALLPDDGRVTLVGDSVMLGSAPALLDRFGERAIVDAKVARQAADIAPVLRQLEAEGRLGATVVVQVGINGTVTDDDLRAISGAAPGRRLLVINGRVPRSWQDANNATIGSVVPELPNASVLDWYRISDGRRSWYLDDGVHFNADGQVAYAEAIAAAVQDATEDTAP